MAELPTILVIEDDDAIQGLVEDALSEGGFETALAATEEEAVTLLAGRNVTYRTCHRHQLARRFNGWEVARAAREVDPTFPVIYMSGAAVEQWPIQGVPHSIMLQKPFAPAQLVTAVSNLVNGQSTIGSDT